MLPYHHWQRLPVRHCGGRARRVALFESSYLTNSNRALLLLVSFKNKEPLIVAVAHNNYRHFDIAVYGMTLDPVEREALMWPKRGLGKSMRSLSSEESVKYCGNYAIIRPITAINSMWCWSPFDCVHDVPGIDMMFQRNVWKHCSLNLKAMYCRSLVYYHSDVACFTGMIRALFRSFKRLCSNALQQKVQS